MPELELLTESDYQLAFDRCAVTGSKDDLKYVSPKSGRAVSKKVGLSYNDKLLILPKFLTNLNISEITLEEKKQAFALTNYFFNRYLFCNKKVTSRQIFIEHIYTSPTSRIDLCRK